MECKYIFWNIIHHLHTAPRTTSTTEFVVSEIDYTKDCDCFAPDFANVRNAFMKRMGRESYQRIIQGDATAKDVLVASRALVHHRQWTLDTAVKALPIWDRLYYETIYRVKRTIFKY